MQGRGLKLDLMRGTWLFFFVAPYAGAWIETLRPFLFSPSLEVAPYAGAWIETSDKGIEEILGCRPLCRGVD